MIVRLLYGGNTLKIAVPDSMNVETFGLTSPRSYINDSVFRRLFAEAGGEDFLAGGELLIVVNDAYRHTPTEMVLSWLETVDSAFAKRSTLLIATGAHQAGSESDLDSILGRFHSTFAQKVQWHDATDHSSMTEIGQDRFDQPVLVNRLFYEAKKVLIIGSVEPHYFAGYTGGRKSVFPGLCDLATIERNHNLANSLEAQPLRLISNPVAEHLSELISLASLEKVFTIQLVTDQDGRIVDSCCGLLGSAFERATESARHVYAGEFTEQFDLLLAEVRPPLDRNLYQIQKALENTQGAVKDAGSVVLVSACNDGIGSEHFFEQAAAWDRDSNCPSDGVMRFGSHKLSRVNAIGRRINVGVHSTLPTEQLRQVFFEPVNDIEEHIVALENKGARSVAVVHDAGHTVLHRVN